jgi:hypothetical protein
MASINMVRKHLTAAGLALLGLAAFAALGGIVLPCHDCCDAEAGGNCFACCYCAMTGYPPLSCSAFTQFTIVPDGVLSMPQVALPTGFENGLDRPPRKQIL